ncbi:MAG: hypothetical protein O3C69_00100 [Chloroflexi bacterium]|nr:hypothetical protein [Chloroflexota bacterium]
MRDMMKDLLPSIKRKSTLLALGGVLSLAAIACGSDSTGAPAAGGAGSDGGSEHPTPPPSSSIQSGYDAVRQAIEANGTVVVRVDEQRDGIFDNPVTNVLINGESVAIYEFPSVTEADKAALTVSSDGTTISSGDGPPIAIDFLNRPHYFQQANVIAVYTGGDTAVITLLRDTFGEEFAGYAGPLTGDPGYETVLEPAPIESVEVGEDADEPGLFVLYVTTGLPSGCASFEDWSVVQTGELELTLTVLNRVPAPDQLVACTEIYGIVEHTIPLGSAATNLDACELYTVRWQNYGDEESLKFQVTAPNIRCANPYEPVGGGDGDGPVITPIIADIDALIFGLQAAGVNIVRTGEKGSEIFGFTSEVVLVNGERVEIFSFGPGAGSLVAASGVSLDGSSFNLGPNGPVLNVSWISTPHLYLAGNSIVLYVGTADDVVKALDAAAGQKFAGPGGKPVELPADRPEPLPLPGNPEVVVVPAPVVSVGKVAATKSLPPQYFLQVTSAQPNGCERDAGWEVEIDGTAVHVTVLNNQPADLSVVLCAAIYGETVHSVALGSDGFQRGVEYSLFVNKVPYGTFMGQ